MNVNDYPDLLKFYYICDFYKKEMDKFLDDNYRFIESGCMKELEEIRKIFSKKVTSYDGMIEILQNYGALKSALEKSNILNSNNSKWNKFMIRYFLNCVNPKAMITAFISYNPYLKRIRGIVDTVLNEYDYTRFEPNITPDIQLFNNDMSGIYNEFSFKIFKSRDKCIKDYVKYAEIIHQIYNKYINDIYLSSKDDLVLIMCPILSVVDYDYDNGDCVYVQVLPRVEVNGDYAENKRIIMNIAKSYGISYDLYDYVPVRLTNDYGFENRKQDNNIWDKLSVLSQSVKYNNVVLLCSDNSGINNDGDSIESIAF